MSQKNCIIIHGCPSRKEKSMDPKTRTFDKHWMPCLKLKLEEKGIKTETPLMSEPWSPKYKEWKKIMDNLRVNESTILIGHSCGGGFLVRWLGETQKKIKKLILVAPAIIHGRYYGPLKDLLKFEINTNIKDNVGKIIIFVSDDDSKGILKSAELFSKSLGAKKIVLNGKGHFTLGDMKTEEFPELLNVVLNNK